MEKAKAEATLSMLRDILEYYGNKSPKLPFKSNYKLIIRKEIITWKMLRERVPNFVRFYCNIKNLKNLWTLQTSAEDMVEVVIYDAIGNVGGSQIVPSSYYDRIEKQLNID